MNAGYWGSEELFDWFVEHLLKILPAPLDRICTASIDVVEIDKRSRFNPFAKKSKKQSDGPWVFGLHLLVVCLHWGCWRIPVAFRLVLPKSDPNYVKDNELVRQMLPFIPWPEWAETKIVLADSAFAAKDTFKLLEELGLYYVIACAKTWNFEEGIPVKEHLKKLKKHQFKKVWYSKGNRRREFYVRKEQRAVRHLGNVGVVFTKLRRNASLKATRILLTNLPKELTARQILGIYHKRWMVEVLFKELKSGLGIGQHQVTRDLGRVERSISLCLMAYLMLLRLHVEVSGSKGESWSFFSAREHLSHLVMPSPASHSGKYEVPKLSYACKMAG